MNSLICLLTLDRMPDKTDYHIQKDGTVAVGAAEQNRETAMFFTDPYEAKAWAKKHYPDWHCTLNFVQAEPAEVAK
jgi:hypothetical protein